MARVASSPLGLHRFRPHPIRFHQIQQVRRSSINPQNKICRYQKMKISCCQTTPNPTESSSSTQVNTLFSSSITFSKFDRLNSLLHPYACSVRVDELLFEWIYFLPVVPFCTHLLFCIGCILNFQQLILDFRPISRLMNDLGITGRLEIRNYKIMFYLGYDFFFQL